MLECTQEKRMPMPCKCSANTPDSCVVRTRKIMGMSKMKAHRAQAMCATVTREREQFTPWGRLQSCKIRSLWGELKMGRDSLLACPVEVSCTNDDGCADQEVGAEVDVIKGDVRDGARDDDGDAVRKRLDDVVGVPVRGGQGLGVGGRDASSIITRCRQRARPNVQVHMHMHVHAHARTCTCPLGVCGPSRGRSIASATAALGTRARRSMTTLTGSASSALLAWETRHDVSWNRRADTCGAQVPDRIVRGSCMR